MHIKGLTSKRLHVGQKHHFLPLRTLLINEVDELRLENTANISIIYVSDTLFVAIDSLRAHFSHMIQGLT